MIEITEEAKLKVSELLTKNPGKCLRIEVEGDGCAGPYLRLSLDKAVAGELKTKINDLDVLVSDQVQRLAEVTVIRIFANHIGDDLT